MLAAVTSFSVVRVRRPNMFLVVACLFLLTFDYTWCVAKSQANKMLECKALQHFVEFIFLVGDGSSGDSTSGPYSSRGRDYAERK